MDEIQLISDDEGLALIGDPTAIELMLVGEGLKSSELDLARLLPSLGTAAAAVDIASQVAANAGRWVKLTEESARLMQTSRLMTGSVDNVKRAVLTTDKGKITGILEIVQQPAQFLANPAVLGGIAGLMSQMAMQKAMGDIHDYLEVIDRKVDDILRAQKDAVLADMIAVGFVVEEAMTLRAEVGHVSETTWSKVQSTSLTIARTQAYALRQLDALAERLETQSGPDALVKTTNEARRTVQEWLVVLARCFQLQDAVAVLELDRILNGSPDELERHRVGLKTARRNRLELISRSTMRLLDRMDAAAGMSNLDVVFNPFNSRAVVEGTNQAGAAVVQFHSVVGVAGDRRALEAKRWVDAAQGWRDEMFEAGAEGVGVAVRAGTDTLDRARTLTGRLAGDLSERLLRPRVGRGAVGAGDSGATDE